MNADQIKDKIIKRSPIQGFLPKLENDKIIPSKLIDLPKQIKCPGCGRLIRPIKI